MVFPALLRADKVIQTLYYRQSAVRLPGLPEEDMEKKMKKTFYLLAAAVVLLTLNGCFSGSPYDYGSN